MLENIGFPLRQEFHVFHLSRVVHAKLRSDWTSDTMKHDNWEFIYIESGSVKVCTSQGRFVVNKGEMICLTPLEEHSLHASRDGAEVIIAAFRCNNEYMGYFKNKVLFTNQQQRNYLRDIAHYGPNLFCSSTENGISNRFFDHNPHATPLNEQIVRNTLELLVLSLLADQIDTYMQRKQHQQLIDNIKAFIRANLSTKLSLAIIAKEVSYSVSSIKRIFREFEGCSIHDYVHNQRIDYAKELLRSDLSITQIATMVGFGTISYFTSVFTQATGLSPKEYRATLQIKPITDESDS